MDHTYIEENQVIDRYVMERLTATEAANFEAHYLDCQQCLDELALTETFLQDFKQATARKILQAGAGFGLLSWLSRRSFLRIGFLTVLLIAVYLPTRVGFERRLAEERQLRDGLESQLDQARWPQANIRIVPLQQERSLGIVEPSHRFQLDAGDEWIVLALELETTGRQDARYRLILIDGHQAEIWRQEGLEPDALGNLSLSLHGSWLEPGVYRLRVEAFSSPDISDTVFSFRVLASP